MRASFWRHGVELKLIKPDSCGPCCRQHPDIFQSVICDLQLRRLLLCRCAVLGVNKNHVVVAGFPFVLLWSGGGGVRITHLLEQLFSVQAFCGGVWAGIGALRRDTATLLPFTLTFCRSLLCDTWHPVFREV